MLPRYISRAFLKLRATGFTTNVACTWNHPDDSVMFLSLLVSSPHSPANNLSTGFEKYGILKKCHRDLTTEMM